MSKRDVDIFPNRAPCHIFADDAERRQVRRHGDVEHDDAGYRLWLGSLDGDARHDVDIDVAAEQEAVQVDVDLSLVRPDQKERLGRVGVVQFLAALHLVLAYHLQVDAVGLLQLGEDGHVLPNVAAAV